VTSMVLGALYMLSHLILVITLIGVIISICIKEESEPDIY
jgi:hypothetical protein